MNKSVMTLAALALLAGGVVPWFDANSSSLCLSRLLNCGPHIAIEFGEGPMSFAVVVDDQSA